MTSRSRWSLVVEALNRPYRVTMAMVVLVSLVPLYIFIPEWRRADTLYAPEIALDRRIPVQPAWALVYGALYLFLILLPILIVRQEDHIRRTVYAYLAVWLTAYVFFIVYPTRAPRPATVPGDGFAATGLRFLYGSDPPYNCFPSLHVAHSFISALTCVPLHRRLGIAATVAAALVAVSTLFTRQHYVLDVIAGAFMAFVSYAIFLRNVDDVPELDRAAAPIVAAALFAIIGLAVAGAWLAYRSFA